jgi:hypothetical protein
MAMAMETLEKKTYQLQIRTLLAKVMSTSVRFYLTLNFFFFLVLQVKMLKGAGEMKRLFSLSSTIFWVFWVLLQETFHI